RSQSPPRPSSPLSLHDALPIYGCTAGLLTGEEAADLVVEQGVGVTGEVVPGGAFHARGPGHDRVEAGERGVGARVETLGSVLALDRKSTRLNSSHVSISYAVFC